VAAQPHSGDAFVRPRGRAVLAVRAEAATGAGAGPIFTGHGSNKFDALNVAGFFARYGIAPSASMRRANGVDLDPLVLELVRGRFRAAGIEGMATR